MKRFLIPTLALSLTLASVSCSPSAEDKTKDSLAGDSQKQDLQNDANHFIDSMNKANAMKNDSTNKDSIK